MDFESECDGEIVEQVNQEVNQRNNIQPEDQVWNTCQRPIIEPFDSTLLNARPMCTNLISLDRLKLDYIYYDVNLNKFHIDVQIMRIIALILNINASIKYF